MKAILRLQKETGCLVVEYKTMHVEYVKDGANMWDEKHFAPLRSLDWDKAKELNLIDKEVDVIIDYKNGIPIGIASLFEEYYHVPVPVKKTYFYILTK